MPPASSAFQARQNGFRPYPSSNPNQPITNDGGMNDMGGLQEPYTGTGSFNNPGQDGGHRSNLNEPDPSGGLFEPPGDSIPSPSGNHVTLKPHIERVMDILNLEDHLREMVNEVISCTQPEDYFGVTIAMMGRLEQEFNKQAEIKADNADANWIAVDRFKDYARKSCSQLFIDPTLESFATLLTDGPRGQNDCLERRVLSDLLSENANDIRDTLPNDYVGEDGSMGAAAVSAALKELERNGRSTFRKLLLQNVLPKSASLPVANLRDFSGHMIHKTYPGKKHLSAEAIFKKLKPQQVVRFAFLRLASVANYTNPPKDRRTCQWQLIDEKLIEIKEKHSLDYTEAFGRLVLIKDHKFFNGVRLYKDIDHTYKEELVLPTEAEVILEVASPSEVPEFHKSLAA